MAFMMARNDEIPRNGEQRNGIERSTECHIETHGFMIQRHDDGQAYLRYT